MNVLNLCFIVQGLGFLKVSCTPSQFETYFCLLVLLPWTRLMHWKIATQMSHLVYCVHQKPVVASQSSQTEDGRATAVSSLSGTISVEYWWRCCSMISMVSCLCIQHRCKHSWFQWHPNPRHPSVVQTAKCHQQELVLFLLPCFPELWCAAAFHSQFQLTKNYCKCTAQQKQLHCLPQTHRFMQHASSLLRSLTAQMPVWGAGLMQSPEGAHPWLAHKGDKGRGNMTNIDSPCAWNCTFECRSWVQVWLLLLCCSPVTCHLSCDGLQHSSYKECLCIYTVHQEEVGGRLEM